MSPARGFGDRVASITRGFATLRTLAMGSVAPLGLSVPIHPILLEIPFDPIFENMGSR